MKYIVVNRFNDSEDNLATYVDNQEYPRTGAPVPSSARVKLLMSKGFIAKAEKEVKNGKEI